MKNTFAGFVSFIVLFFLLQFTSVLCAEEVDNDGPANDTKQSINVYGDVDLTSKTDFSYARSTLIKYIYPELSDSTENEAILGFNQTVLDILKNNIDDFKNKVKKSQASLDSVPKNTKSGANRNNLVIDFNTSVIQAGKAHIISIRFSMQGMLEDMPGPYHEHDVLNYDLTNNTELRLSDLFNPDSDYLTLISNYARESLKKHLVVKDLVDAGTEPNIENFSVWNLKTNGILFTFEESQVTPYMYGAQTILVPYSVLKDVISPDSPIAACVKNKRGCSSNHLLTGGFIDEARVNQHSNNTVS